MLLEGATHLGNPTNTVTMDVSVNTVMLTVTGVGMWWLSYIWEYIKL